MIPAAAPVADGFLHARSMALPQLNQLALLACLLGLVKGEGRRDPGYILRSMVMEEDLVMAVSSSAGGVQNIRGRGREGEPRDARGGRSEERRVGKECSW